METQDIFQGRSLAYDQLEIEQSKEKAMNAKQICDWRPLTVGVLLLAWIGTASGQSFSSGSTGADGALNPASNTVTTVQLPPGGVLNYTTVNIPINATVQFSGNAGNTPVVILATGDVTITGVITVSGGGGYALAGVSPPLGGGGGPGGFAGGNGGVFGGVPPTAGKGPGGGLPAPGSPSYGAPASFVSLIPLFGGSGGGGGPVFSSQWGSLSGGGGGGAILIASSTRINIVNTQGAIRANGGSVPYPNFGCTHYGVPGSGGAIRLVAPTIIGGGHLQAVGGTAAICPTIVAGSGRIRLEAYNLLGFTGTATPIPSVANAPGPVSPAGNPALVGVPALAIASINGVAVPSATGASYYTADMTLPLGTVNPIPVVVAAANTPVGSPTEITVRLTPQSPGSSTNIVVPSASHTGTFASSTAITEVNFPVGQISVIQAFAAFTLTGQTASLFPLIDGEPVERVRLAASPGESSTLNLITKSGKEVRVDQLGLEDRLRVARAWEVMRTARVE